MQTITKIFEFDAMHRVMHERFKCFNVHGHRYIAEITFSYSPHLIEEDSLGYAIDFKEIKRIAGGWIDTYFDHGSILNPKDTILIDACQKLDSKLWIMSLNGDGYCNPSAENIGRELFIAMRMLFSNYIVLNLENLRLYETPTCYTDCTSKSIAGPEQTNWLVKNKNVVDEFLKEHKQIEYDARKLR